MKNNMSGKKKILIFSTAYYPFVGGAEVAIKEITDRISPDYEFDLITARLDKKLSKRERVGNVDIYRVGLGYKILDKLWLPFGGAILTRRLNQRQDYFSFWAVMVSFASGAPYIFNIFRRISGKNRVPIVLTLQEGDSENHLQFKWFGLISLSWRLALRRTALLTGISNFLINRAKKHGYLGESILVPNGVDLKLFTEEIKGEVKNKLITHFDKKSDDVYLVSCGRLTHKNGIDTIIKSLKFLPRNVSLVLIGKGELRNKLEKEVLKLNLKDRVKFVGFIPYKDLPKYYSICNIFIRPSRSEGFGNAFIEAMASKLPVIASPVGGIVDFIDDQETGLFCAPDNPQSIVKVVNLLLKESSLRERIVKNAYNRVILRYSWDDVAKEMALVFNRI